MPTGVYDRAADIDRFWSKVVHGAPDECWVWESVKPGSYANFHVSGSRVGAHRFSYEQFVGPIHDGMVIDHLCRNTRCVNPAHLDAVPMVVNTERGNLYETLRVRAAALTHCKRNHALSGENLKIDKRGDRMCKTCQRDKAEEWRVNNRARVNELQRLRRSKKEN